MTTAVTTSLSRRGLKRTCQDDDCGVRFYDLNKATITCPVCGAGFTPPPPSVAREVTVKPVAQRRPYGKPFGGPSQPAAASPLVEPGTADAEADEIADEVADISVEVDEDAVDDDKAESILELDDDSEDVAPVVVDEKDIE